LSSGFNALDGLKLNVDFATAQFNRLKSHENPVGAQLGSSRTRYALHDHLLGAIPFAFEMQDVAAVRTQAKTRRRNLGHGLAIDEDVEGPWLGVDAHRLPRRAASERPTRQDQEP
jgi:hypothetical protein